jgi:hypothetical protein
MATPEATPTAPTDAPSPSVPASEAAAAESTGMPRLVERRSDFWTTAPLRAAEFAHALGDAIQPALPGIAVHRVRASSDKENME